MNVSSGSIRDVTIVAMPSDKTRFNLQVNMPVR